MLIGDSLADTSAYERFHFLERHRHQLTPLRRASARQHFMRDRWPTNSLIVAARVKAIAAAKRRGVHFSAMVKRLQRSGPQISVDSTTTTSMNLQFSMLVER